MEDLDKIREKLDEYLDDDSKRHKIKKPYINNSTVTIGLEKDFCKWAGIDEDTPIVILADKGKFGKFLSIFVPDQPR